jgi:cytochrome c
MKLIYLLALSSLVLTGGVANANEALAKSSGCLNCHNVTGAKKIGPSFATTAAKFKGKPDAEATLTAKLSDSKMHPATKCTPEERAVLVKWVLAQ